MLNIHRIPSEGTTIVFFFLPKFFFLFFLSLSQWHSSFK